MLSRINVHVESLFMSTIPKCVFYVLLSVLRWIINKVLKMIRPFISRVSTPCHGRHSANEVNISILWYNKSESKGEDISALAPSKTLPYSYIISIILKKN